MASSVGRIALGVVGAVVGAPFGLSPVGFALGSAVGGALFVPDGPDVEGPRLGDTSVSASSLGKIIPEHYGVVRTNGNVIWSGGIKETKSETSQGGKGGGGPTSTEYSYSVSFATSLGRARAKEVRKIWADGKLIYDGTGDSKVDNKKYSWNLRRGGPNTRRNGWINQSISRRLAGMPDINEGSGPQAEYTTIADLITQMQSSGDDRSQLYATKLQQIKHEAESGLTPIFVPFFGFVAPVPNYRFDPAYRQLAVLVFNDMKLEDFGNRIPNITAEVVWEGATGNNGLDGIAGVDPTGFDVSEVASTAVPDGLMATDLRRKRAFTHAGNAIRRFNAESASEDRQKTVSTNGVHPSDLTNTDDSNPFFTNYGTPLPHEYGWTIKRMLTVTPGGDIIAVADRKTEGLTNGQDEVHTNRIIKISRNSLEVIDQHDQYNPAFAVHSKVNGSFTKTTHTGVRDDKVFTRTQVPAGDHVTFSSGSQLRTWRWFDGTIQTVTQNIPSSLPSTGPLAAGDVGAKGTSDIYVTKHGPDAVWVGRYRLTNVSILFGYEYFVPMTLGLLSEKNHSNPFSKDIDYISATIYDNPRSALYVVVALVGGGTGIMRLAANGRGVEYTEEIANVTPPKETSGLSRSDVTNNTLAFASGRDLVRINLGSGTSIVYTDVLSANASNKAQLYIADIGGLLIWEGTQPRIYRIGTASGQSRDHDLAEVLPNVIRKVCKRAGMSPDEYSVSGVGYHPVRGYSIARPSSARQVLEQLMKAYFVEGVETDWKVRFSDLSTATDRVIDEKSLGAVSGPTGPVNWLESRAPEHEIPAKVNINFSDPLRDYQTSTAHKKRVSNPVPSMYSQTVMNMELPLVMKEHEARDTAERLLFLSWMSRSSSKTRLDWTHADLDPGDIISVKFRDGRKVTDRISKATLGANFEIEVDGVRSSDPVYESAPQNTIPTGNIPSISAPIPVSSKMFVFDTPLLFDYHETGRTSARYYTAVGTESSLWTSATIFKSLDAASYASGDTVNTEITWGTVQGFLPAPRALWTTDHDNELRISLGRDRGDIVSVTREEILNGANRALVFDQETGLGEIIQFQNVTTEDNGSTYVLSTLTRGLRGTDYAVDQHVVGETFLLLDEANFQTPITEMALLGTTGYFKAVSNGELITSVAEEAHGFAGRALMPYAPSRLRRTDNGSDLTITWNRRTRVGGSWDMMTPLETVPLNEDFEQYELYLLPVGTTALDDFSPKNNGSFVEKVVVNTPTHTFNATKLAEHGITLSDTVNVVVYQVSAQVGRGFARRGALAP